jgi:hypothetical protein
LTAATPSFFVLPFRARAREFARRERPSAANRGRFALDQIRRPAAMRRFATTIPLLALKGAR